MGLKGLVPHILAHDTCADNAHAGAIQVYYVITSCLTCVVDKNFINLFYILLQCTFKNIAPHPKNNHN